VAAVEALVQKVATKVKPLVPLQLKRTVKRRLPARYWRYFDPDWHRRAIGYAEEWDTHGPRQLEYLREQGLHPEHYFLDVGCGPLRGGVHFIAYLDVGHYFGVDKNEGVLETAREVELKRYGVEHKRPTLVAMENFDFAALGQEFDYAWAQSVFTHLPLNNIIRCVVNIDRVLKPGGRFFATFYENLAGKKNLEPIRQSPQVTSYFDEDSFHYDFPTFEWIADATTLDVEYLGDWGTPRNQKVVVFTKRA
jgi:SAM-dependent methyltransferase